MIVQVLFVSEEFYYNQSLDLTIVQYSIDLPPVIVEIQKTLIMLFSCDHFRHHACHLEVAINLIDPVL